MNHSRSRSHAQGVVGARHSSTRGSIIFVVLILAVVMAVVFASVVAYLGQAARIERRSQVRTEAAYAADYAFEKAYTELKSLLTQHNVPNISHTTSVTNLTTAPTDTFTAAKGYTWKTYLTVPTEDGVVVGVPSVVNPAQGAYRYLTIVELERSNAAMGKPVSAMYQREWIYTIKPLFQYAIFYDQDMELFPGAAFVVGGRVHSNGTIYTGTTASISFSDWVTNVTGVSNQYAPNDPRAATPLGGTISYTYQPATTSREEPPGILSQDTTDANRNNDGTRELIEVPRYWDSDPNSSDRLYTKAGLKILVNSTNTAVTADSGVAVPRSTGGKSGRSFVTQDGTVIPAADPLASVIDAMISTGTPSSMQDYREGTSVTTVDVNVANVTSTYNAGGLPATIPNSATWTNSASVPASLRGQPIPTSLRGKSLWNGIVYVADVTDSSVHRTGVKIINGATLPAGTNSNAPTAGLTIVSNNAAYIVGDYNTGGSPPVNSGSSLTANNYASGYTVQPAAVVADAVTVVSSAWASGNYNTVSNLNSRTPANTTINTALISGVVASSANGYSGGVENFIRLLENWSGRRLTYYGSINNLYTSQQSTAPWQTTGNYYNAPTRNWYFDTNFKDPSKVPPGTPSIRSVKRGQWAQLK